MPDQAIKSPIKAMVWKIEVAIGQQVSRHDPLVILESMKTEIPVDSWSAGVVHEILVKEGQLVEEDQVLVVLGPDR